MNYRTGKQNKDGFSLRRKELRDLLESRGGYQRTSKWLSEYFHYPKNIYQYNVVNRLMDKHAEVLDELNLLFKLQYIPLDCPQPKIYM